MAIGSGSGSGSNSNSGYSQYIPPTPQVDYGVELPATQSPQPMIDAASVTLQNVKAAINQKIAQCIGNALATQAQISACVTQSINQAISENATTLSALGAVSSQVVQNLYASASEYAASISTSGPQGMYSSASVITPLTQTQQANGETVCASFYWAGPNGPNSGIVHANFDVNSPAGYYYWNGSAWTTTIVPCPPDPIPNPSGPLPPSPTPIPIPPIPPSPISPGSGSGGCSPSPYNTPGGPGEAAYKIAVAKGDPLTKTQCVGSVGGKGGESGFAGTEYYPCNDIPWGPCTPDSIPIPVPTGTLPPTPSGPLPPTPTPTGPCPPVPVVKVETCRTYDLVTDLIRGQLTDENSTIIAYLGGTAAALINSSTLADADAALYKLTPHLDPSEIVPSDFITKTPALSG